MEKTICDDCKNDVHARTLTKGTLLSCSMGMLKCGYIITECTHFNPKPKKGKDFKPQRVDGLADLKQNVSACCKAKVRFDALGDKLWHCKKCGKPCQFTKIDWKPRKYKK